jgi:hypothetical protein
MKNKDFLDFIINRESPPAVLKHSTLKDITLTFRAQSIFTKFLTFQIIGALLSMSVCPQFSLGLVEGHGITHTFRMIGDWACAAFCGSLFLTSGLIVAFIGMKGEELWWIWRRYKISLIFLPTILWSALMLTNVTLQLPGESFFYHLTWIAAAVIAEIVLFQIRSATYLRIANA